MWDWPQHRCVGLASRTILVWKVRPADRGWDTEGEGPGEVFGLPLVPEFGARLDGDLRGDLREARHFLSRRVTCLAAGIIRAENLWSAAAQEGFPAKLWEVCGFWGCILCLRWRRCCTS